MKRGFFRADCYNRIGFGHLNRVTQLAKRLKAIYPLELDLYVYGVERFDESCFDSIVFLNEMNCIDHSLEKEYEFGVFDFSHRDNIEKPEKISNYLKQIRNQIKRILLIDSIQEESLFYREKSIPIDSILIPYAGVDNAIYPELISFLGPSYFIFSQEIEKLKKSENHPVVKNILITMGGSDVEEMTLLIVESLKRIEKLNEVLIKIAIGPYFKKELIEKIKKIINFDKRFVLFDGRQNFLEELNKTELCISASGLTKYEAARLGIPTILISYDFKMFNINSHFLKYGTAFDLGVFTELDSKTVSDKILFVIENENLRKEMNENSKKIFRVDKIRELFAYLVN